jgi:uncharacterized coiled-coil protein SlyX
MENLTIDGAVAAITALIAMAGMVSGIFALAKSTRKEAFDDLKHVVAEQKITIADLKEVVAEQKSRIDGLEKVIDDREEEIDDLKDWAERLVDQVQKAGLAPVSYRRRRARTGKK